MATEYEWDGNEFPGLDANDVARRIIEIARVKQDEFLTPEEVASDHRFADQFPETDPETVKKAERMIRALRRKGHPDDSVAFPSTARISGGDGWRYEIR